MTNLSHWLTRCKRFWPKLAIALIAFSHIECAVALRTADSIGDLLEYIEVPDWAVGNALCQGTIIAKGVIITAGHCINKSIMPAFYFRPDALPLPHKKLITLSNKRSKGDIGIYLFSKTLLNLKKNPIPFVKTAQIPSYQLEEKLLSRKNTDLSTSTGSLLKLYGRGFDNTSQSTVQSFYTTGKPLIYKPLISYWTDHPEKFYTSLPCHHVHATSSCLLHKSKDLDMLFDLDVYEYWKHELKLEENSQAINDRIILSAEEGTPVIPGDSGGGVFVKYQEEEYFVGVISGYTVHSRLKQHWPWIVNELEKHDLESALLIAWNVLGTSRHAFFMGNAHPGDIYIHFDKHQKKLKYFRLLSYKKNGRMGGFPKRPRKKNKYWYYLGNKMPSSGEALQSDWRKYLD